MKIILFNGPPGAGKDTVAQALAEKLPNSKLVKFAEPLKNGAAGIYFGGDRKAFNVYDTFEKKGKPEEVFSGKSCREVQIAISEQFLKIFHHQKIFGEILAREIKKLKKNPHKITTFLVSDSGFAPEAEVLVEHFGADKIILIRIHRDEYTYERFNDSRSYINLDHLGVQSHDFINVEGEPHALCEIMLKLLEGQEK